MNSSHITQYFKMRYRLDGNLFNLDPQECNPNLSCSLGLLAPESQLVVVGGSWPPSR